MSDVFQKVRIAFSRPDKVPSYLRKTGYSYLDSLTSFDFEQLVDTTGSIFLGERYLRWRHGETIEREVQGSLMRLDVSDTLAKQLITYGIREPVTTRAYQRQLAELKRTTDQTISVLEIGANVGYYALIAAAILGDRGKIHAVEPGPGNYRRLLDNIELNDYDDYFYVEQCGLGPEDDSAILELSDKSNLHRVVDDVDEVNTKDHIEVDIKKPSTFLGERDLDPASINVIRMDVEGMEHAIFPEFQNILAEANPLLVQVELHARLTDQQFQEILDLLSDNDLEIVSAARNDKNLNISSYDELSNDKYVELVLAKK